MMEQHQQPFRGHLKITSEKCDPPFPGVMLILITTYNFLFCFGHSMWDLSSLIRDQTLIPWISRWILNHWTTREVPRLGS